MSGLNRVIIIGNLGSDPEMRFTASGKPVTNFTVAVNDGQEVEWCRITAWNKTAELCNQYLGKGKQVCVEGRLHTEKWDDTEGVSHQRTTIVANRVVFLGKKDIDEEEPDIEPTDDAPEILEPEEILPEDIPF